VAHAVVCSCWSPPQKQQLVAHAPLCSRWSPPQQQQLVAHAPLCSRWSPPQKQQLVAHAPLCSCWSRPQKQQLVAHAPLCSCWSPRSSNNGNSQCLLLMALPPQKQQTVCHWQWQRLSSCNCDIEAGALYCVIVRS
jgi:hypothetical protein